MLKKILNIATWLVFITIVVISVSFVSKKKGAQECQTLTISVNWEEGNEFINEDVLRERLAQKGYYFEGQKISELNLEDIEGTLYSIPELKEAQVYKDIEGNFFIKVIQRKPIVRLINQNGTSFYIDDEGKNMPLSNRFTARVLVINGAINFPLYPDENNWSEEDEKLREQIVELAHFISKNDLWKAQILQVYVNKDKEFELIPRVGEHRLFIGDASNIERKFNKLEVFYKEGLYKADWNQYDTINLKYNNQIICNKKQY